MVLADDAINGVETESRTFADILRSKKRLEDARLNVCRNPGPVVCDLHHNAIAFAVCTDRDSPVAVTVESIDRIIEQIGPDLIQLAAIRIDK